MSTSPCTAVNRQFNALTVLDSFACRGYVVFAHDTGRAAALNLDGQAVRVGERLVVLAVKPAATRAKAAKQKRSSAAESQ